MSIVRFERRRVEAESGHILLIIPVTALRAGKDREQAANTDPTARGNEIAAAIRSEHGAAVRVSVFCGRAPEAAGSWQFADDVDQEVAYGVALELVRAQIVTLRYLFMAGVCMHVRIDFGGREQIAFRRATLEVRRELEAELARLNGVARELAELDAWLLRNFVFHFTVSVDRLIENTLNGNIHAIKQRIKQAERRRQQLSPALLQSLAS